MIPSSKKRQEGFGGVNRRKEVSILYHIAICDDDPYALDTLQVLLTAYSRQKQMTEFKIEQFDNPEVLLKAFEKKEYDPNLLFLDICMPEIKGIQVAEELRKMGSLCKIIFITNSKEYALDAFRVGAVQYLVKPILEKELFPVLEQFFLEKEKERFLILKVKGVSKRVALSQIVCCEAQGNYQCLYLSDNSQLMLRMTLTGLFSMVSGHQEFVKVGSAYFVNLRYVDSLNAQELHLDTGMTIRLPRGTYPTLKEQYFQYYCEEERL